MNRAALWCLFAVVGVASGTPSFQDYRVDEKFDGKPAVPVLQTKTQRTFRTAIRQAAAKGPNFAGHYTVAEWGCGAGCVSIAVIDAKTGAVTDGPWAGLSFAVGYHYEGGEEQLVYKRDSRLLVARGCPNEDHCGTYYYEWVDGKFRVLKVVEAK